MRFNIVTISAVLAIVMLAGAASAAEYFLTNTNTPELSGIKVKVVTDGDGKTISVQLANNPVANTPKGIDKFYYNLSNPITSANEAGWNFHSLSLTGDGFGKFAIRGSAKPAGEGGISSPIVFTLTDKFTNIPPNKNGATVAVHVRFSDDCSGFVSDGRSAGNSDDDDKDTGKGCRPPTNVPEFPTIALPIAALIGLVFIFQHRKK